jgi:hypothetical protein
VTPWLAIATDGFAQMHHAQTAHHDKLVHYFLLRRRQISFARQDICENSMREGPCVRRKDVESFRAGVIGYPLGDFVIANNITRSNHNHLEG